LGGETILGQQVVPEVEVSQAVRSGELGALWPRVWVDHDRLLCWIDDLAEPAKGSRGERPVWPASGHFSPSVVVLFWLLVHLLCDPKLGSRVPIRTLQDRARFLWPSGVVPK
jgi:hypothetical protein